MIPYPSAERWLWSAALNSNLNLWFSSFFIQPLYIQSTPRQTIENPHVRHAGSYIIYIYISNTDGPATFLRYCCRAFRVYISDTRGIFSSFQDPRHNLNIIRLYTFFSSLFPLPILIPYEPRIPDVTKESLNISPPNNKLLRRMLGVLSMAGGRKQLLAGLLFFACCIHRRHLHHSSFIFVAMSAIFQAISNGGNVWPPVSWIVRVPRAHQRVEWICGCYVNTFILCGGDHHIIIIRFSHMTYKVYIRSVGGRDGKVAMEKGGRGCSVCFYPLDTHYKQLKCYDRDTIGPPPLPESFVCKSWLTRTSWRWWWWHRSSVYVMDKNRICSSRSSPLRHPRRSLIL